MRPNNIVDVQLRAEGKIRAQASASGHETATGARGGVVSLILDLNLRCLRYAEAWLMVGWRCWQVCRLVLQKRQHRSLQGQDFLLQTTDIMGYFRLPVGQGMTKKHDNTIAAGLLKQISYVWNLGSGSGQAKNKELY